MGETIAWMGEKRMPKKLVPKIASEGIQLKTDVEGDNITADMYKYGINL
jgi:hypothetical protein